MKRWNQDLTRRHFLYSAPVAGAALVAGSGGSLQAIPREEEGEVEVTPAEDLMREHGVLKRVLLVYEEVLRRIHHRQEFPPDAVADSAGIIRSFIEEYHEKLEEDHLFPRFRKAGRLVSLVDVLEAQHHAGRKVTDEILTVVKPAGRTASMDLEKLADAMRSFVRMYAPHEAREDTVLFPELAHIVSRNEYDALGEEFEDIEHQTFGEDGFEAMVDKVAGIEKRLGIYDLAQFTPK